MARPPGRGRGVVGEPPQDKLGGMPKSSKTQKTAKGYEIPVPTRKEVFEALEKAGKGRKAPKPDRE